MIIARTLLFLAGLIWMQHLMVRRVAWRLLHMWILSLTLARPEVLAVETTSRRHFGGRPGLAT